MERKPFARLGRDESGKTLIDWLSARFTYLSADGWRTMLDEGRVEVDGAAASPDRILAAGETVFFDPPPLVEPEVDPRYSVVMEDEDFLVVDKSGNLPCHPSGRFFEHSLWYLLRADYGEVRIATRLDRETSGLVLVCRSASSAAFAQGLLSRGRIAKDYLVLVHGAFPERLDASGYLIADEASAVRKKRRYVEGGPIPEGLKAEACATSFELLRSFELAPSGASTIPVSLLRARPATGRTHQIRATLFSLGFPLVGDKLYGLDEGFFLRFAAGTKNNEDLTRLIVPNQALHCAGLAFTDRKGRAIDLTSKPRWALPMPGGLPLDEQLSQLPWRT
jgi:23S rRNA-/tRNA-specific pseudouridylate synthase